MSNRIKISTLEMAREDWLKLRRCGIGGSDASTIVGLNPWGSKLELYADKMGLIPEKEDNEAMRQGRDFEDYVAQRWCEVTGKKVRRENHILYNDDYPWAFANLDRVVVGEKAILECKTTSVYNKSDFENGEVPDNYYVQCQHYLAVTGYDKAYLAVLVLNKGFYHYEIMRSDDEIKALMEAEEAFWNDYVVAQKEPPADGSESAMRVLESRQRREDTVLMMDLDSNFDLYQVLSERIKGLEKERDTLKQGIIQRMGDGERGQAIHWSCSYLQQTKNTVDAKKLQANYPQAYAECAKTSEYRVFRTKEFKEDK